MLQWGYIRRYLPKPPHPDTEVESIWLGSMLVTTRRKAYFLNNISERENQDALCAYLVDFGGSIMSPVVRENLRQLILTYNNNETRYSLFFNEYILLMIYTRFPCSVI